MKKVLALTMATVFLAGLLAACGGSTSSSTPVSTAPASAGGTSTSASSGGDEAGENAEMADGAIKVNGINKNVEAYTIDGQTYYQLRDIAMVVNGTSSMFSLDYDTTPDTVAAETGMAYTALPEQLVAPAGDEESTEPVTATANATTSTLVVNGETQELAGYTIDGNDYYLIDELAPLVGLETEEVDGMLHITTAMDVGLEDLSSLTIEGMRNSGAGSQLEVVEQATFRDGEEALFAAYDSDGLRVYTRIDLPSTPMPEGGYPIVIFAHGWIGADAAATWTFGMDESSMYGDMVLDYKEQGFAVLTPGFRGHGTFGGVAAEGIEYMSAYDNGSYLSPIFYAQDVVNLLYSVGSMDNIAWGDFGYEGDIAFNYDNINLSAHSQGGDVALTALAATGEGAGDYQFASASIWAGCFPDRVTQLATYAPMAETLESFMSGDGTWNGTAIGADGEVNPNFIFGYPSDWIGTVDTTSDDWTWQADSWSTPTVGKVLDKKANQMYTTLNTYIADMADVTYSIAEDETGRSYVMHDPIVEQTVAEIGGFGYPQYLSEPLTLHLSDQDYYSHVSWNEDLATRINGAGGQAQVFVYPQNNHSLRQSDYEWFSEGEVIEGYPLAIESDVALFGSN